ncbi:MAG: hypothetical protein R2718_04470 [Solirubrobacterales bacterium]
MTGRYPPEEVIAEALLLLVAIGIAASLSVLALTVVVRSAGRTLRRWAGRPRRPREYIVGHVERNRATAHLIGRDQIELLLEWPSAAGQEEMREQLIEALRSRGLVREGTTRGRRRLLRTLAREPDGGFVLEVARADALLAYLPIARWLEAIRRLLRKTDGHARRMFRRHLERSELRPLDKRRHSGARGAR